MIVNVRLFGILGKLANKRLVALLMPESATLGDVLAELGKRFGQEFVDRVLRAPRELHAYCQVFVNDNQVDDLETRLKANGSAAEVGIILLMASEGG